MSISFLARLPRALVRPRVAKYFSTSTSGPRRSDAWLATFARELRAELGPARDVPGLITTSLFDMELWERLPPDAIRFAARQAFGMSVIEWRTAIDLLLGRAPRALKWAHEEEVRILAEAAAAATAAAGATADKHNEETPITESARSAALLIASRLGNVARDEDLRSRLTAMGTEALGLARDALDEFLLGYQEGKGEEIRAFINEEMERESGFVDRIKKIRNAVHGELDRRPNE
jgi:hypothetical protein